MVDTTTLKGFKESSDNLLPKKNKAVFFNEQTQKWDYFEVELGEERGLFVDIKVGPPVVKLGYITFEKKLFEITPRDILRGRFNVRGTGARIHTITTGATNLESGASGDPNESGPSENFSNEEREAADLAFKEQIGTLQYILNT